ncbi:hypothetical protein [Pontibacter fetidus]|uniref:Glycosyltransferase family 61 protein n=1 Tax=Pontibacter fetidus TaxID=2700082 RepID=A0A6B2H1P9_9BACT|nr:hypothetical protein [Pontibacter fetidus]NDK54536.1 hypothetical protein [Pontibacter fetidus]
MKQYDLLYYVKKIKKQLRGPFRYGTPEFFDRANLLARLNQVKYLVQDYVIKPKYKTIEYRQEFQQELIFALPFAYWHFLNGTLKNTISSKFTKELYFFSEGHEEKYEMRICKLPREHYQVPNLYHSKKIYFDKWARVPLKQHYANNLFVFSKPMLVIANKYNTEWGRKPVNYLSMPVIDEVLARFSNKYQIVYNRPKPDQIVMDNSEVLDMNDFELIKKNYPDVLLAEDLYVKYRYQFNNYNHFQLMLYANCDRFLSVHGGTAALASYFGGKNIIFSRRGHEHNYKEFETIFPVLSGAEIYHAKSEKDIFKFLEAHY